jgi:hypothetical protein
VAILDQARGTPTEIFADVVFHLIDAGKIAEKDRAALLDEMFLRAGEARQPMPARPASIVPVPTTPAQLHLDELSIKCRAVQALLAVDGKRARDRFSQIAPPRIPKPACTDSVFFDPTVYFETLAAVATKAPFTAEEQKKQVPFWMMADAVSRIQTSIEIIAAARNLSQMVHTESDAMAMSTAFATALGIDDSNRNFSGAMHNTNLVDAVLMAAGRFGALGASPQTMQSALRGYLVRHLTASRCQDSMDAGYSASLSLFNTSIAGQTVVLPISDDESKPAKVEGKADIISTPDHKDYADLADGVSALFAGREGNFRVYGGFNPAPAAALPPGSQPPDVNEVLTRVREWKGSGGENIVDVFRRKAGLYLALLNQQFLPSPKPRDSAVGQSVLSSLIATLEDPAVLEASPSDWLSEVQAANGTRRFSSNDPEASKLIFPKDITQAMIASHLSALSLYGKLAIIENPPPSPPPNRLF